MSDPNRKLWRVDYHVMIETSDGRRWLVTGCVWKIAGWLKTRRQAQKFIDDRAALPCRIVRPGK